MADDLDARCDAVLTGDRRAVARLLTLVEGGSPAVRGRVLARLAPHRRGARIVGLTGPPGAGKSTLVSALTAELRAAGRRVGILAVDPSSPLTGGALLGDRVRMQEHHADDGVFIRSLATRGQLGGLAAAVPAAALVLDVAGADVVLVETVGVGQSEVDVMAVADVVVAVLAPGVGDSVQAAKAGVLEVADVLVVNRADQPGAGRLESELRTMLAVGHEADPAGRPTDPPVLRTVAVRGEGVAALLAAIDARAASVVGDGPAAVLRARRRLAELAVAGLRGALADPGSPLGARLAVLADRVAAGGLDAATAAARLLGGLEDAADAGPDADRAEPDA